MYFANIWGKNVVLSLLIDFTEAFDYQRYAVFQNELEYYGNGKQALDTFKSAAVKSTWAHGSSYEAKPPLIGVP